MQKCCSAVEFRGEKKSLLQYDIMCIIISAQSKIDNLQRTKVQRKQNQSEI